MAMKRLFDFTFAKSIPNSWIQRWQSLFTSFFGKRQAVEAKSSSKVQIAKQSTLKPTSTPPLPSQQTIINKKEMHSSVTKAAAVRLPMIKFIGARLPRPFFDRASLPPLQISGNIAAVSAPAAKTSSIGPVGKIPRGQGVDPSQLPAKFRRSQLSEEECEAINAGFFYQR